MIAKQIRNIRNAVEVEMHKAFCKDIEYLANHFRRETGLTVNSIRFEFVSDDKGTRLYDVKIDHEVI